MEQDDVVISAWVPGGFDHGVFHDGTHLHEVVLEVKDSDVTLDGEVVPPHEVTTLQVVPKKSHKDMLKLKYKNK